jgi:hypothetical protein
LSTPPSLLPLPPASSTAASGVSGVALSGCLRQTILVAYGMSPP